MFQFPWYASIHPMYSGGGTAHYHSGFPHSEIPGSKLAYSSPRRFVVRHVLHRLLVPRHPPCALSSLTNLVIAFITKVFRIVS